MKPNLNYRYQIINPDGQAIESHESETAALEACGWINEHETRNARPPAYKVHDAETLGSAPHYPYSERKPDGRRTIL